MVRYLSAPQGRFRNMSGATIDSFTASEGAARGRRHCVHVMRVSKIVIAAANHVCVANVGVVYVDPIPVAESGVVPRMVRLAPTQREPANSETDAKSKAHAAAEEADKGGTVD